jgi:hypothetical protein
MMPWAVTVRVRTGRARPVRLWVPFLPVALALSPLLPLVLAVLVAGCLTVRINPLRALAAGWRLLSSLRGLRVEVDRGRTAVLVNVT